MSAERPPEKVGTAFSSGGATNKSTWKLTLPCTRAEAEAIDASADIAIDAVLMTTEEIEDDIEAWRLDAYFETAPDAATIAAVRALAPSALRIEPHVETLPDEDWVTLSQAGLEPIREGRFVVHTGAQPAEPPPGGRAFLIEASQAFGTGHHDTTAGCLAMLDALAAHDVTNVIDLGTGTGLLAFAARHLWPDATVTATDIDAIAIDVTRANMAANHVERIALIVADGTRDPAITGRAPYDLVIANILAGPLIDLAADVTTIAAPGATIVLAGLLAKQAEAVTAAYAACGAVEAERLMRGDWAILRLRVGDGS